MSPRVLLHLEGAAVLTLGIFLYHGSHGSWIQFALLFFLPDVSILGYLANPRLGAATYNAIHTYVGPLILAGCGLATGNLLALRLGLIWISHIGFDRLLGFGLKYPTRFKDTHLNPARHAAQIS